MFDFVKKLWLKRQHRHGTYVSADMSVYSKVRFKSWTDRSLTGIGYGVPTDKYHATISYSRKPFPDVVKHKFELPFYAKVSGWKIFDNIEHGGERCLVAVLDCPELHALHEQMRDLYGATWDHDEYIPHVTVCYTYSYNDVPDVLPSFELEFNGIIIEPLDEDKDMT